LILPTQLDQGAGPVRSPPPVLCPAIRKVFAETRLECGSAPADISRVRTWSSHDARSHLPLSNTMTLFSLLLPVCALHSGEPAETLLPPKPNVEHREPAASSYHSPYGAPTTTTGGNSTDAEARVAMTASALMRMLVPSPYGLIRQGPESANPRMVEPALPGPSATWSPPRVHRKRPTYLPSQWPEPAARPATFHQTIGNSQSEFISNSNGERSATSWTRSSRLPAGSWGSWSIPR